MEIPKTKLLKPYSGFIFTVSVIETLIISPGNLFDKLSLAAFSFMSAFPGFGFSVLILCGCFLLPKMTGSVIEFQHLQNCRDAANLLFVFGIIASAIIACLYPFLYQSISISFSLAPLCVGVSIGANWIWIKYRFANPFASPDEQSKYQ